MSPRFQAVDSQAVAFLQKDYELKAQFLTNHYSRMWTRFNFFMVAMSGIHLFLFDVLSKNQGSIASARPLFVLCAILALCWYCFGAQDRYLVAVYRTEIKRVADQLAIALRLEPELEKFENAKLHKYVPVSAVENTDIEFRIYQWRSEWFSTTKLAAWFPLLVTGAHCALFALSFKA